MKTFQSVVALVIGLTIPGVASAERIQATLVGYEEVPAVSTPASGEFRAMISPDEQSIDYELTYTGLVGAVQQSHIHIGQLSVNGGIVIWLCQTATTPAPAAVAGLTPVCPAPGGTVTGTITAANVLATAANQQIAAGELAEVIAAIRAGVAYANVHATPANPGGEVRGQIRASSKR